MTQHFRNRSAQGLWAMAAVFLLMLGLMTRVLVRDGAPAGAHAGWVVAAFAVFWLAGLALAMYAARQPCLAVSVHDDGRVRVCWRYPWRRAQAEFPAAHLARATVVEDRDSEGDPYFYARVVLSDGQALDLAESHRRAHCLQVCARFNAALRQAAGLA